MPVPGELQRRVVGVHDDDTLTVLDGQQTQHKVRLYGIDAPEAKQDFGSKAKQELSALVFNRDVRVVVQNTDRYGRPVGQVYVGDRYINLVMVAVGWAGGTGSSPPNPIAAAGGCQFSTVVENWPTRFSTSRSTASRAKSKRVGLDQPGNADCWATGTPRGRSSSR